MLIESNSYSFYAEVYINASYVKCLAVSNCQNKHICPRGDDSEIVIILTTMKNLFLQNNWAIFNHNYHKTFVEGKGIIQCIIYPWPTIFDICFLIE